MYPKQKKWILNKLSCSLAQSFFITWVFLIQNCSYSSSTASTHESSGLKIYLPWLWTCMSMWISHHFLSTFWCLTQRMAVIWSSCCVWGSLSSEPMAETAWKRHWKISNALTRGNACQPPLPFTQTQTLPRSPAEQQHQTESGGHGHCHSYCLTRSWAASHMKQPIISS